MREHRPRSRHDLHYREDRNIKSERMIRKKPSRPRSISRESKGEERQGRERHSRRNHHHRESRDIRRSPTRRSKQSDIHRTDSRKSHYSAIRRSDSKHSKYSDMLRRSGSRRSNKCSYSHRGGHRRHEYDSCSSASEPSYDSHRYHKSRREYYQGGSRGRGREERRHHDDRRRSYSETSHSGSSSSSSERSFISEGSEVSENTRTTHLTQRTADTTSNSESRLLKGYGKVVHVEDLSDYSDHFTLGSKSLEEFEGFMKKHESKAHQVMYTSDSDVSSTLYSLPTSGDTKEQSNEEDDGDSGVVASQQKSAHQVGDQAARRELGTNMLQACLCAGGELSVQGSYGGLRDDEILIANCSSISTKETMDLPPQRIESEEDDYPSQTEEEEESQNKSRSSESGSSESSEGRGLFGISFPWSQEEKASGSESDRDPMDIPPQVSFVSQSASRSHATMSPTPSKTVVWERSESATVDSCEETLEDSRVEAITKKARADNILSKFKRDSPDDFIFHDDSEEADETDMPEETRCDEDMEERIEEDKEERSTDSAPLVTPLITLENSIPSDTRDDTKMYREEDINEALDDLIRTVDDIDIDCQDQDEAESIIKDPQLVPETMPPISSLENTVPAEGLFPVFGSSPTLEVAAEVEDSLELDLDQELCDQELCIDDPEVSFDSMDMTLDVQSSADPTESAEKEQMNAILESEASRELVLSQNHASVQASVSEQPAEVSFEQTFVLGDNTEVVFIAEVETGSGDTGFLIYLDAIKDELSERGKHAVTRFSNTRGVHDGSPKTWHSLNAVAQALGSSVGAYEATIMLESTMEDCQPLPRLVIEETAGNFLTNLSQLSEASYYCLDEASKAEIENTLAAKGTQIMDHSNSLISPSLLACRSDIEEESVYFMFCMRLPIEDDIDEIGLLESRISMKGSEIKETSTRRIDQWQSIGVEEKPRATFISTLSTKPLPDATEKVVDTVEEVEGKTSLPSSIADGEHDARCVIIAEEEEDASSLPTDCRSFVASQKTMPQQRIQLPPADDTMPVSSQPAHCSLSTVVPIRRKDSRRATILEAGRIRNGRPRDPSSSHAPKVQSMVSFQDDHVATDAAESIPTKLEISTPDARDVVNTTTRALGDDITTDPVPQEVPAETSVPAVETTPLSKTFDFDFMHSMHPSDAFIGMTLPEIPPAFVQMYDDAVSMLSAPENSVATLVRKKLTFLEPSKEEMMAPDDELPKKQKPKPIKKKNKKTTATEQLHSYESRFRLAQKLLEADSSLREHRTTFAPPTLSSPTTLLSQESEVSPSLQEAEVTPVLQEAEAEATTSVLAQEAEATTAAMVVPDSPTTSSGSDDEFFDAVAGDDEERSTSTLPTIPTEVSHHHTILSLD